MARTVPDGAAGSTTRMGGEPALHAVSLFSNCGAGDLGYRAAGFTFDVLAELDPRRLDVALLNHPGAMGVPGDLRETWSRVVDAVHAQGGAPALLAACPPCQGMSTARSNRGRADDPDAGNRDARNLLVWVIGQVATALRPQVVVVENVPAFLSRKVRDPESGRVSSAANILVDTLRDDYCAFPILADLADYGVPQTRVRTFLTFLRRGTPGLAKLLSGNRAPFPRPTHAGDAGDERPVTVRKALAASGLPPLDASSSERAAADGFRGLHAVPVWRDRRYPMVAAIPPGSGKTAWENDTCQTCGTPDQPRENAACTACGGPLPRPIVREPDGQYRLVRGFHSSSYRRMRPDVPAATVTTASGHVGSDTTIHPFENRVLSPLECALLQTFPPSFDWGNALERWGHTNVRAMIGEAVPPAFTHLHGRVLRAVLTGEWTLAPISLGDPRCQRAFARLGLAAPDPLARPA